MTDTPVGPTQVPTPLETADELVGCLYRIISDQAIQDQTPLEVFKRTSALRKLWRANQPKPVPSWVDFCLECHTPYPRTHLPWETRGGVDVSTCQCNDQHSMVRYQLLVPEAPGE